MVSIHKRIHADKSILFDFLTELLPLLFLSTLKWQLMDQLIEFLQKLPKLKSAQR